MAFWNILLTFGIFVFIWYIISSFSIMYQEKSGIPGQNLEGSFINGIFAPRGNVSA
jgi:hypothetical protein